MSELSDVIVECSDPGIAHIKFKWWQEEIERLFENKPRHPVTREMAERFDLNQDVKSLFNESISTFESMLLMQQPDTLEQALSLFEKTTGKLWRFTGELRACNEQKSLDLICKTGALYHYISCLQQANIYLTDSRFIIPTSLCNQNEPGEQSNDLSNKFISLFTDLKHRLDNSYHTFPKKDQLELIHVLILNRLGASLCNEILEDNCKILDKKISLTPIRKLWIAWSAHASIKYLNWV